MAQVTPTFFFDDDVGVVLTFTVLKPDGTPQNLTSATVTLLAEDVAGSPFSCTVTDAANGVCTRTVQSGDFSGGTYRAQLKIVSGSNTYHTEIFVIQVGTAL